MAYANAVKFIAASSGTGDFVVSAAALGFQTPAAASVPNGYAGSYRAESADLSQWEYGTTTYNSGTTTFTRTVVGNSLGTTANINFSAAPAVMLTASAEDLANASLLLTGVIADARMSNNALLDRIYLSKAIVAARRQINCFADGFKNTDGVAAGSSSNYVIDTTSGYVGPAPNSTTTTINVADTTTTGSATIVDRTAAITNSITINSVGVYSTAAASITIKILKENSSTNYDIVVSKAVSHPGTGWVDFTLSSPYAVPGSGTYRLGVYEPGTTYSVASGASRAIIAGDQGVQTGLGGWTAASGAVPPTRYTYNSGVLNMTVVTNLQTTDANVSTARVVIEFDNAASPPLNTDITVEVTCNGGTNWTSATLSAVTSYSQSGRKVAATAEIACTAGTSFGVRTKSFNNKNIPVYGIAVLAA